MRAYMHVCVCKCILYLCVCMYVCVVPFTFMGWGKGSNDSGEPTQWHRPTTDDPPTPTSMYIHKHNRNPKHRCDALMRHACGALATTTWVWATDASTATAAAVTRGGSSDESATAAAATDPDSFPYRVVAARDLGAGEELTVDYRGLSYRGLGGSSMHGDGDGTGSGGVVLPAPAVGALGFRCECCGREVFR